MNAGNDNIMIRELDMFPNYHCRQFTWHGIYNLLYLNLVRVYHQYDIAKNPQIFYHWNNVNDRQWEYGMRQLDFWKIFIESE